VIAFSVGEEELAGIDTKPLVGHLALELLPVGQHPGEQGIHRQVAGLHQETPSGSPMTLVVSVGVRRLHVAEIRQLIGVRRMGPDRAQRSGLCASGEARLDFPWAVGKAFRQPMREDKT
jgi:hypothetical protein